MTEKQLREKIVAEARSQLGVTEHPPGSNRGPDVQKYQHVTFLGGSGWFWCAAFADWCWKEAGTRWPYDSAGAWNLLAWAQQHGADTEHPKPGDGVVFNIGSGHIGVFLDFGGADVKTIDGNWSNSVEIVEHPRSEVRGYINAAHFYHAIPPKVKAKRWELVTSHTGEMQVVWRGGRNKKLPGWVRMVAKSMRGYKIKRVR